MSVVSTWSFSRAGVQAAGKALAETQDPLEAVETGISIVEEDPSVTSVGYGGLPNSLGHLQLDAALMTSDSRQGAVLALNGCRTAIPVARAVLTHSPHPILSGPGALEFARKCAHPTFHNDELLTAHARSRYQQFVRASSGGSALVDNKDDDDANGRSGGGSGYGGGSDDYGGCPLDDNDAHLNKTPGDHGASTSASSPPRNGPAPAMKHTDTVGMLARARDGRLAAGCATSGMQFKANGRVGDAPIFGAGLYADVAGAAVATGDGDRMVRFCLSFLIVERMRAGDSPQDACFEAAARVARADATCQAAVLAMRADGEIGAACTHAGFTYVVVDESGGSARVVEVPSVAPVKWHHSCV